MLEVVDPRNALWQAAQDRRDRFSGTVIAVAGGADKAMTRHMVHAVLGSRFRGSAGECRGEHSMGVPLAMSQWSEADHYAVLELPHSSRGDVARSASLCRPQIGIVGRLPHRIAPDNSASGVEAQAELLAALDDHGLALLNGDDRRLRRCFGRTSAKVEWIGRGADCDLVATNIRCRAGRLSFAVEGRTLHVPIWGRHHLPCVLSAARVGRIFGLGWDEIASALAAFQPPLRRCQVTRVAGKWLIDDTSNSSPDAMRAALELLRDFDAPGRRIVVCGEIGDRANQAADSHHGLGGEMVTTCGADLLVACGEYAQEVVQGARDAGMPREQSFACAEPLDGIRHVECRLREGDVILVKGVRSLALDQLVAALGAGRFFGKNRRCKAA